MKYLSFIILMLSAFVLRGQNDSLSVVFTLNDCLDYAFSNSYERKQLELTNRSHILSYEQSKQERLPNVSASISENFSNDNTASTFSGNVGINTGMTLYQGGYINATIEQQRLTSEQSSIELNKYDDNLSIQILQAFLTIIGNQELLKYQQSILNSSREAMKQGQKKFEVGSIIESDYLLLKAQFSTDTNNVVDTRIEIDKNLLNLKLLLSMDPMTDLQLISPDTSMIYYMTDFPSLEESVEQALAYSPSIKISSYDVEIAKKSLRITKANYYPSVNLNAGISTGHSGYDNLGTQFSDRLTEQVGISLNIPIYSRGSTKLRVKQNEIAVEQKALAYEQELFSLRQNVAREYHNMISSYNKYNVSKQTKDAYYKSFEAYNVQFQFGSITAVELLQQQNSYLKALNDYIQNKYTLILQRKILDIYMGKGIL